jgi:hypothetical protein
MVKVGCSRRIARSSDTAGLMVDEFVERFTKKVDTIRRSTADAPASVTEIRTAGSQLTEFAPVTTMEVSRI